MNKYETYAVGIDLPSSGIYTCKGFEVLATIGNTTIYGVTLDETIHGIMFSMEPTLERYVNNRVLCSFRSEVVETVTCLVINEWTTLTEVSTLSQESGVKLYLTENTGNRATGLFSDIREDNPCLDAIFYCTKQEIGRSTKAIWLDATLVDAANRIGVVRTFDPLLENYDITGNYVHGQIVKTKYGFQSDNLATVESLGTYVDPTVKLCENYLREVMATLPEKWEKLFSARRLIESLHTNDSDYNIHIAAIACHLAQDISNVTPVKVSNVTRCILTKFLGCTSKPHEFLGPDVIAVGTIALAKVSDPLALGCFDDKGDRRYLEVELAEQLIKMATTIVSCDHDYFSKFAPFEVKRE